MNPDPDRPLALVTGGTGFIGSYLVRLLITRGYRVRILTRQRSVRPPSPEYEGTVEFWHWIPERGIVDSRCFQGVDVLFHLAGYPVFRFWVRRWWHRVWSSRIHTMRLLFALWEPYPLPRKVISMSAIGYYGDGGDAWLDESSPRGEHPLAFLVEEWEHAARLWTERGVPATALRTGIVLGTGGGIFPMLDTMTRLGMLAPIRDCDPWFSWISVQDVARAFLWVAEREVEKSGEGWQVWNLVAPNPVRFSELVQQMYVFRKRRRWVPPIPSGIVRRLGGPMGRYMVMSQRVSVEKFQRAGFSFETPDLQSFLDFLQREGY